jgi:hypothetical protein
MTSLARACLNVARRARDPLVRNAWPDDRVAGLLTTRAPVSSMTLADAVALQHLALHFVASLTATSAAAAVIARSLRLTFDGAAQIGVPGLTLPTAAWLGEETAIPIVDGTSSAGAVIDPYKVGVGLVLTNEMINHSNAEAMMRQVLIENVGPVLDVAMFGAGAGVPGVNPPGILNGIAPLAASSLTGIDAMVADVAAIAQALAPSAGGSAPILITAPAQAVALAMLPPRSAFEVFASGQLPAGRIVAVVPAALATVVEAPGIVASSQATVHMSNAPAAELVAADGTVAGPQMSMFQTDSVVEKLTLPATWALRSASAVAWFNAVTW